MKNLKFYLIIAALAIGLICLGFMFFKEHQKTNANDLAKQTVKDQILTGAKEIARTVKANGTQSLLLDITNNHTPIGNVNGTDMPDIIDTAAMALDIRTKQLNEVTVIAAQYKAEKIQLKAQLDSMQQVFYTYTGNGLNLKFTPPYSPTQVATADFMGRFGITIAKGNKSHWYSPWKSNQLMSVTSDSPYFLVDHVNYIGFDKDPLKFHLEAQASASFTQMTGVGVGPGLKLELGRFDLEGNYQYYQQQKNWMYGAKATFKLVGF